MIRLPVFFLSLFLISAFSIYAQAAEINLRAVPTYESCSIYVEGTSLTPDKIRIQYREEGSGKWLAAHPLSNSKSLATPRGSLFHLKSGTKYEAQAINEQKQLIAKTTFTTWSNTPPIAETISIKGYNPSGESMLLEGGGTEKGWVRYLGDGKTVIDGKNRETEAILIENGSYIILENLIIKGGKRHGIRLLNCSNIRIINCDISGFGRVGIQKYNPSNKKRKGNDGKYYDEKGKMINWDAGVYIERSKKITIEHNYIHDPRNTANSWFYSHPAGPNAVFVQALGEIVIRYNDFIGSNQHRWNDVIEGYGNRNPDGGFNCDSDIYGNYLAFANDDGIELDGGQRNIRFWGNKVEGMLCGISTAPNLRGPCYIFNNLVCNLGDQRGIGSAGIKNGGGNGSEGRTYFYNNTFFTYGRGIAAVGFGNDKNRSDYLATTRNNLIAVSGVGVSNSNSLKFCDFDYDFFSTINGEPGKYSLPEQFEKHAKFGNPLFTDAAHGLLTLQAQSPALHGAQPIQGLSDTSNYGAFAPNSKGIMPLRANSILPNVNQIILSAFRSENKPISAKVNVTFTAGSKEQPFTILRNSGFNWLQVSPSSGTAKSGQTVVLTVTADPAKIKGTGIIPSAFVIKLANGQSVPVSVFCKVFLNNFLQHIPAAQCAGADKYQQGTIEKTDQSYLKFIAKVSRKPESPKIKATVSVPEEGDYYISLQVNCPEPGPNHDSIFYSINSSELKTSAVMPGNFWHWVNIGTNGPLTHLKKGENSIELMPREDLNLSMIRVSAMKFMPGEKVLANSADAVNNK